MLKRMLHVAQTVMTEPIEAEGTEIELKTVKAPLKGLHVYGKSTQETTDGVNICSTENVTMTWENAEDGSIINTYDKIVILNIRKSYGSLDVFKNGAFLLFDSDSDVPITAKIRFDAWNLINNSEEINYKIKKGKNKVILPEYNFVKGQVDVYVRMEKESTYESPGTPYTFTLSNILVKAGQEEHEYEPYTEGIPSPNPNYLQEIMNVGESGSLEIMISEGMESKQKQTMNIPTQNGLFGIPVNSGGNYIDESGQQWVCDEVDFARGVYIHRVFKITFGEMLDYFGFEKLEDETKVAFYINIENYNITPYTDGYRPLNAISDVYKNVLDNITPDSGFMRIGVDENSLLYIVLSTVEGIETVEDFEDIIIDYYDSVIYIEQNPVETPLAEADLSAYKALHSNYPTTIITNSEDAYMKVNCLKILGA